MQKQVFLGQKPMLFEISNVTFDQSNVAYSEKHEEFKGFLTFCQAFLRALLLYYVASM